MNSLRSRNRRKDHESSSIPAGAPDDPHAIVELSERRMLIENAMADLPLDQREVVVMKIWGEMTFSQIGKVMSLPRSTAHATYGAAMTRLHEKLRMEK